MKYYFTGVFLFLLCAAQAQEIDTLHHRHTQHQHGVGLSLSMTNIPIAHESGTPFAVWAPTIGIEYGKRINIDWDIGILSDIELISYDLKGHTDEGGETLVRENAWVTVLTFFYHPNEHIRVFFGPGIEVEKHKNLFVTSVGFGYHMHRKKISAMPFFKIDLKGLYYSTSFGIVIGTTFK
jgi:hypothetical protein